MRVCTADGSTERAVDADEVDADAEGDANADGAVDGAVVGAGVRLGMRGSAGELGSAVGLGALVPDEAGGGVGLLLAGAGRGGPWGS